MERKYWLIVFILLGVHIFFRFYQLETRSSFGWDQVDNAWAAKNIIVDHKLPLLGLPVKQNTGFYLGPAYYYLITPFYLLFNLDPIASGVFAGITSILTFFTIFFIIKKIFSVDVALITIFIHTVSIFIINSDRVQWNVNFIVPVSLIIFYCLYNVLIGELKYILFLALAMGFFFHIHFTAIYFIVILLCTLPFFPKNPRLIKYILWSIPLFLIWFIPIFISEITSHAATSRSLINYVHDYYHGFHLRRLLQLAPDAFIELEAILFLKFLKPIVYFLFPLFIFFYLRHNLSKKKLVLCYLMFLWFFIPWIMMSAYSGEISNYYFFSTRPIALIILSFLLYRIFIIKNAFPKIAVIIFLSYYSFVNVSNFFAPAYRPLAYYRKDVEEAIRVSKIIRFSPIDPESYIYYVYKRNENTSNTHKK